MAIYFLHNCIHKLVTVLLLHSLMKVHNMPHHLSCKSYWVSHFLPQFQIQVVLFWNIFHNHNPKAFIINMAIYFLCNCIHKLVTVLLMHSLMKVHNVPHYLTCKSYWVAHFLFQFQIQVMIFIKNGLECNPIMVEATFHAII